MDTDNSTDQKLKRAATRIRKMEIDDLAQVYHLGEDLFTAEDWPSMYRTWDQFEIAGLFQSDSDYCLVAEAEDESIVGFALGTIITKPHSAWTYGWLIWLGVSAEYQRHGLAEKLFNRFKEVMLTEGVRMLIVDTEAENLPALRLFRKLGFGQPRQHIYLSMNIDADQQRLKQKNGLARTMRTEPK